ncbi:MAG: TonB-dependent receptor [Proteobacteria bacterium]|nr:TonB-dependent receptor [Pseudomonadota bacterium]
MAIRVSMPMNRGAAIAALALLLSSAPLLAQDPVAPLPDAAATGTFLPADFARFAPRNALDMLKQVPGFAIQQEDGGRGLGQASGNVLINGERLSSKSDNAEDQLARIPAGNVIRIEIVDGATLEIPGLSGRVANIVVQSSSISGQFEWEPQLPTKYAALRWSQGKVSVSGTTGPVGYTVALTNSPFRGGTGGPSQIINGNDTLRETRFVATRAFGDSPKLSGAFRIDGPGSSVANLNLSYQWDRFHSRELDERFLPGTPDDPYALGALRNRNRGRNYEIGGDIEFTLGPGRLKLIGLDSHDRSDFSTQFILDYTDARNSLGSRFALASNSGEQIARAEYGWKMLGGDWQLSGEAAFNRLDNVAGLFVLDPSGTFVGIPFPQGTGGVTEDRYEGILSYGRPLASNLTMQVALGGEYSKIAQTGPNAEERSFKRPKGSLSLAWQPEKGLDVSFKLKRAVGQLNFGDFLADVNLNNNNTNSGNNQLVPSQSWEAELQVAKNLGDWGSATLTLYEQRIQDYVTIVPLPGPNPGQLVESQGNVDGAQLRGVSLKGTFKLEPLGFKGAKIDVDANFQLSSLEDPLTGEKRAFDFTRPHNFQIDFRHDVPGSDWAWGWSFRSTKFAPYYRLAEVGYDYNVETFGGVFIEHKNVFGLTVRARMNNLLGGKAINYRTVYGGPRNVSPVDFVEDEKRSVGTIFNFLVKGNF